MTFNPANINFLTVGNFSDPSFGIPLSQPLTTSVTYGLNFANSGASSPYQLQTTGNLLNLMNIQKNNNYGILVSTTQSSGGLITRSITGNNTIAVTNPLGQLGNIGLSVLPSSTVQLINTQISGIPTGSARSTVNFIAGTNMGMSYTDTGSQTNITFNATTITDYGSFITYTADSILPNAQNIGLLTTGLVKNTVSGGVATLSTAVEGVDYILPTVGLVQIASLEPVNGSLLYYTGNTWTTLYTSETNGQFLTTISPGVMGWTTGSGGGGGAPLDGNNIWTGTNQFNTSIPTSTLTPNSPLQFVTKAYADLSYSPTALLSSANDWTYTNAYNHHLPTSTLTPTTGIQLITKAYADATYAGGGAGAPTLAGDNIWTGTNEFDSNLPTSILSPSAPNQFITNSYADSAYASLSDSNTFTSNQTLTGAVNSINTTTFTNTSIYTEFAVSGLSGNGITTAQASITTTNTTPTLLYSIPLSSLQGVSITGQISGASSTFSDITGGSFSASAGRASGGDVIMANTPFVVVNATSSGFFTISANTSTQTVDISVIGLDTSYKWVLTCNFQYIS